MPKSRGRMCPTYIKDTFDKLGIPEAERKFLAGVSAQYESEVVYHSIREDLREARRHLPGHGLRSARVPGPGQGILRHGHPGRRQQVLRAEFVGMVGWLVHLRAQEHARGDSAAGLFPHQRGEHGPVRADADHRRRRLAGALHRRLHGADLLVGLAALGGGGVDRQARRAHPLHDDSELVQQRLQPGDQAGGRVRRRDGRVGRRQPRLEGHDEVPGGVSARRAGASRNSVGCLRRAGPAAGRGWQGHPRRADTTSTITSKSISKDGGTGGVSRPAEGRQGRRAREGVRALRCTAAGRKEPQRHVPVDRDRRRARRHRTRGNGQQGLRRAALLSAESRSDRDRSQDA